MKISICIILAFTSLISLYLTRVIGQEKLDNNHIMYTQDWPQKEQFRFLQIGDTQNPKKKEPQNDIQRAAIFKEMIRSLKEVNNRVDFIVHSGDFVDHGGDPEEWKKYFDGLFWDHIDDNQKKRFFPALGNHEYKPHFLGFLGSGKGNLKDYFTRFGHIDGRKFYFFFYGNSCFVIMDSGNNGIGKLFGEKWEQNFKGQKKWLEQSVLPAIADNESVKNIFVVYHKCGYPTPVFRRNKNSSQILAMFEDFNAGHGDRFKVVALVGHIQTFSHMIKDYNKDGKAGVHQFCCGCGGGTQHGKKYYKEVKNVADLDLYRKEKYQLQAVDGSLDQTAFDAVRFDDDIFGYLEVQVSEDLLFLFYRYQSESAKFEIDYSYRID